MTPRRKVREGSLASTADLASFEPGIGIVVAGVEAGLVEHLATGRFYLEILVNRQVRNQARPSRMV